ncbi:MAG: response regulator [Myxococcota bacterium]
MSENRRGDDLRVRVGFRVRFTSIDQLVMAFTGDLSRGGMRLNSPRTVDVGTRVSVNVTLPDAGPEMTVLCEVVNVAPHKSGEGYSVGVKFVDPNGEFQQRVEWYILNSEPAEQQFGQHPHRRKLRLVVADDDRLQAEATARPFIERGDIVRLAADGLEALGQCLKEPPDVLLTDVHMPKMDGWQLLRMVRARPQLARMPVLFLTTLATESDRLLGYRLGVDDYLAKPCAPDQLLVRIERAALRATQAARSNESHDPGALRGDLELVGLASVLSFLELERKSGIVRVGPLTNGVIYLRDGAPVHIAVDGVPDNAAPEERFVPLVSARHGRFEFRPGAVDREDTVKRSLGMLLLECARRADEAAR